MHSNSTRETTTPEQRHLTHFTKVRARRCHMARTAGGGAWFVPGSHQGRHIHTVNNLQFRAAQAAHKLLNHLKKYCIKAERIQIFDTATNDNAGA